MAASYTKLAEVQEGNVRLRLQRRLDVPQPFVTVSWRAIRPASGTNRYLYLEREEFWQVPLAIVKALLQKASSQGMLSTPSGRWSEPVKLTDSDALSDVARNKLLAEMLVGVALDDGWRAVDDLRVLMGEEPTGLWRKALIFSPSRGVATLRSLTRDADYQHVYAFPLAGGWRIDKAMMDVDAEVMSFFASRVSVAWLGTVRRKLGRELRSRPCGSW